MDKMYRGRTKGPELSMMGSTWLKGLHTGKEEKMGGEHRAMRDQGQTSQQGEEQVELE